MKVCNPTKNPVKTLLLYDESPYIHPQNRQLFSCFFVKLFALKNFPRLTLGFSQLISVGPKSSVTNSGVKRVIFETFTFYFAQTYSTVLPTYLKCFSKKKKAVSFSLKLTSYSY